MEKLLNSSLNDYAFNETRSFVGANLIGTYHTVMETPYWNPLYPDPYWKHLYHANFVVKNSIKFIHEGKEIIVKEGQVLFGQRHEEPIVYLVDNGTQAETVSFHFQLFGYTLPLYKPFDVPNEQKVLSTHKRIMRYLKMNSELGIGSANAAFMELFFQWMRRIHDFTKEKTPHHEDILDAELYINEHIGEKLSVSEIAERYHFSEKHFRALFTRIVGSTPKKYIERVKLERAYALFKDTDMSVTEISDMLGFYSCHHLTNAFKNAYGIAPSEIRKSKKNALPLASWNLT